jgi:hypothetical protein
MIPEYLFDLHEWRARLAADEELRERTDYGMDTCCITSPYNIIAVEWLRQQSNKQAGIRPLVPADVFLFAHGEPEIRHVTKVGGMPYRPADKPWPMSKPGLWPPVPKPMTFLAQFCFANSLDIVSDLPGEVLLIFAENEEFARPEALYFEWYPLGLTNLVRAADVPPPGWEFVVCYGYRHRTVDYPLARNAFGYGEYTDDDLAILPATKIGGTPSFIQGDPNRNQEPDNRPGRFLGQLAQICPEFDRPYPWINQASSISLWSSSAKDVLTLVDAGYVYLFLDDRNEVCWEFMCG